MIDLHTHSFMSDGELIPSELFRRALAKGYTAMAVTDHADGSNLETLIQGLTAACLDWNSQGGPLTVTPGVELTHVPPALIGPMIKRARKLGAKIVVVHGETLVEPVAPGTNRAAIEGGADVLAHPGLITAKEVELAATMGVALEITTRRGHSLSNGHVARLAKELGAKMVLDTDTHSPGDLVDDRFALQVVLGAGLPEVDFQIMQSNALEILHNIG